MYRLHLRVNFKLQFSAASHELSLPKIFHYLQNNVLRSLKWSGDFKVACNAKLTIAKMLVCYLKWSWKYQLLFTHFWRPTSSSFHSQVSSEEMGELRGDDCSSEDMSDTCISRDIEKQIWEGPSAHFFPFLGATASWAEGANFTQAIRQAGAKPERANTQGFGWSLLK